MDYNIYTDIAVRTGGDIYIGVVGPVRTGKSTFIKRFMETLVLDKIEDANKRARAIDELPQSADGKTIMTTEPKFVPNEAVRLQMGTTAANVRLIDCVGYIVAEAMGHTENDKPRLVKTPWSDSEMPFQQSAELGTDKVITEHSTIGIVMTTDGSVTELPRSSYVDAEARIVEKMKAIGKPFVIVLNSAKPNAKLAKELALSLSEKYETPVIAVNVNECSAEDFGAILNSVLMEFPITSIDINIPKWMRALPKNHEIISTIIKNLTSDTGALCKMSDYEKLYAVLDECDALMPDPDVYVDSATGKITLSYLAKEGIFYDILSEQCGEDIKDDYKLMSYVVKATHAYKEYSKYATAISEATENGYGIVLPTFNDMQLQEPELTKKGSQYGIKIKATAPSLHLMRVDVETEVSPAIGNEQQCRDLEKELLSQYETDRQAIWETNMFGRSISTIVAEDINAKVLNMPADTQKKLTKTVTRIVNESRGGVLCILI
ncbi:MAG: stage IV sporulation protein A [Bacillota bacterium]